MRRFNLAQLSVEQLIVRFVEIGLAQDRALFIDDVGQYNRLFDEMEGVREELKKRQGDQRRSLAELFDHPNAQVRLKAAISTLRIVPQSSREVLQAISDRDEYPQAADARGILRSLDDGSFVPQ